MDWLSTLYHGLSIKICMESVCTLTGWILWLDYYPWILLVLLLVNPIFGTKLNMWKNLLHAKNVTENAGTITWWKLKNQIAKEPLFTKLGDKANKEKNTQEHSTVPSCPSSDQLGMMNLNPQAAEFKPHMQQTVEKDVVCNLCPLLQELPFNDHPNISLEVDVLDTIKTDLVKTKAKLQSTINECSEKRRHVKDLCGSIFRLKSDIQDYKEKCDILKQKHDKVQSENSTLRSQNHILEVDKSSLKSMLGDVQMDNANLKTENISLKSRCSFLQSKQQNVHQRTPMPSKRYSTRNWDFNDRTFYQWQYLKQGWQ